MKDKENTWTGERLETFITNETMIEHLHRYTIACDLATGKNVLDIACGEGYGSDLMSKSAMRVTAIDIDFDTINKAKKKYNKENIEFRQGDILNIPVEVKSFDIITCFETLEHVSDHVTVFRELKRVLKDEGILLISTPDKLSYSDQASYQNPFHKKELYEEEFKKQLTDSFRNVIFCKQVPLIGSLIQNENKDNIEAYFKGDFNSVQLTDPMRALYWLAIASDHELPEISSSFFDFQKTISQIQEEKILAIKNTMTYKLGNFLLAPFKFIRSLINK